MARIVPTQGQWRLLGQAFQESFPDVPAIWNLVQLEMGENPAKIISDKANLPTAVRELLSWAKASERLDELAVVARNANPTNSVLRKASEEILVAPDSRHLESVLGPGVTLVGIAEFRKNLGASELAVGRVEIGGIANGTGFLLGSDLFITCHHVLSPVFGGRTNWDQVLVRFDYRVDATGGQLRPGITYSLAEQWTVDVSDEEECDYVLMRLARKAGEESVGGQESAPRRGWLTVLSQTPEPGEYLFIIQHPDGAPLKLSVGSVVSLDSGNHICHNAATLPGSSGSPCFTLDWKLVGLHQHGTDYQSFKCHANGAINMMTIASNPAVAAAIREA